MKNKLNNRPILFLALSIAMVLLFFADLFMGYSAISISEVFASLVGNSNETNNTIIQQLRFPKAITAILAGISLSLSGLFMQTLFRNPLAGPYVLGISSGSNLAVALLMIGSPVMGFNLQGIIQELGLAFAAILGALIMLTVILLLSAKMKDVMGLLLAGIIIGQLVSALQSILEYFSNAAELKSFYIWNMGSLSNVSGSELIIYTSVLLTCLVISTGRIGFLDTFLLGEKEAMSIGTPVKRERLLIILLVGVMSGISTAFCGPIAFIGLAVPHISRMLFKTSMHKILFPACILIGPIVLLVCDILIQLPGKGFILPLNVLTSIIGAPVILYLLFKRKRIY